MQDGGPVLYRHLVKPGIAGWAQINYPYGASIEDSRKKLNYDLYYLKYAGLILKIQILLGTIVAMVKGARQSEKSPHPPVACNRPSLWQMPSSCSKFRPNPAKWPKFLQIWSKNQ